MLSTLIFLVFLLNLDEGRPECPICDQNDYNPVCAGGKAYSNLCKLKRSICLGNVVLDDWKYGSCSIIRQPTSTKRGDEHDARIIFRLIKR